MDVRDATSASGTDDFCFPDTTRTRLQVVSSPAPIDRKPNAAPLRIAQVAPLFESVPPRTYGGTERIVHYLTEGLVKRGHHVTLFASGDSCTSASLVSAVDRSLRLSPVLRDPTVWHLHQLMLLVSRLNQFDIVHFHSDFYHCPIWHHLQVPQVTTLHNRLDSEDALIMLNDFPNSQVISISDSQRRPVLATGANFVATVHNGIPVDSYRFRASTDGTPHGDYLAFLGRFTPDKGPEQAIEIAQRVGMPLKLAAKIDQSERSYFEQRIQPWLSDPLIEYIGEADEATKNELLGGARALLFPINWPEPFGLVMIEAMACGTPVIAFRNGAVEEVVKDGHSGFIVDSVDEAVAAVAKVNQLSRANCRQHFESNFSDDRMVEAYLRVYYEQLNPAYSAMNPTSVAQTSAVKSPIVNAWSAVS